MNKKITFITPCFCRGADCSDSGEPEIRPASIRGQLHWWFRALGGTWEEENSIFGTVHCEVRASKVVIRVRSALNPRTENAPTLPHKTGGLAAQKKAIASGESFEVLVSWRFQPTESEKRAFERAFHAWLLMGALGLRATRGGGNFSFEGQPGTLKEYEAELIRITDRTQLTARISNSSYRDAESARRVITDTLGGPAGCRMGSSADAESARRVVTDTLGGLDELRNPLGCIKPKRKTSPLRFRIVKLNGAFHIVAVWDGRSEVTGNQENDFYSAIDILLEKHKRIGNILDECFPAE